MKIKLLFAFLLVSFFAVAQPTNYQKISARYRWIAGMFDSTFHIPSGVTPALRGGGWTGAGAIFFNTADSSLYTYTGYNWRKMGATPTLQQVLTAGSTLTTGNTIDVDGNDFSIDNIGEFLQLRSAYNGTHSLFMNGGIDLESSLSGNSSVVSITPVKITISPSLDSLFIDSLKYTLSTVRKKIMLRDTVSGLVENIDPALIGSGSYTFSNGLTEAAGAVKLGGTISESTQIYPDTDDAYDLDIGDPTPFKNVGIYARRRFIIGASDPVTNWSSEIHFYDDSLVLRPGLSKLHIDSLNYTLSTTGKKIMIRDTATGLVQNIDPALLGGGSTNTSVGSGYKVAIDGTNNIKSLTGGYGITLDSATSNQVGIKADTATLFTAVRATIPAGGSGNVTKVGTPANDQIGIWTGDGTIEGSSNVTYNGDQFKITATSASGGLLNVTPTDLSANYLMAADATPGAGEHYMKSMKSSNFGILEFSHPAGGNMAIRNIGAGGFYIQSAAGQPVILYAASTQILTATSTGVGVGTGATSPGTTLDVAGVASVDGLNADRTITTAGTTGNQTINKMAGTVNIAAAGTTVTVTNSLVTANSIVMAVIRTDDATAYIKNVVPASGSFVINLGAAATAEISIGFIVTN